MTTISSPPNVDPVGIIAPGLPEEGVPRADAGARVQLDDRDIPARRNRGSAASPRSSGTCRRYRARRRIEGGAEGVVMVRSAVKGIPLQSAAAVDLGDGPIPVAGGRHDHRIDRRAPGRQADPDDIAVPARVHSQAVVVIIPRSAQGRCSRAGFRRAQLGHELISAAPERTDGRSPGRVAVAGDIDIPLPSRPMAKPTRSAVPPRKVFQSRVPLGLNLATKAS